MYTALSANPYFDDFDESKPYYKILFKPEVAVQARELTQIQSLIQEQIKRFGDNVFVDGTSISGGNFSVETELLSIKLDSSYLGTGVSSSNFVVNSTITGNTSGSIGVIKKIIAETETDPLTVIIKLISGDAFTAAEVITFTKDSVDYNANIQATDPFNDCVLFNINKGIFYVNGYFVNVEPESIVVDKYSNTTDYKIGFVVNETIKTSDDDLSLLDNANGSPNYAAPGADRYEISVDLAVYGLVDNPDNFVELARLENGSTIVKPNRTLYNIVGDELAKRTFDESGNYTVEAFPISLVDHSSDTDKFNVVLDKGSAYVNGYQFENNNQRLIAVERARTTEQANNLDSDVSYGNFLYVENILGEFITNNPTTDAYSTVEIHNVVHSSVVDGTTQIGSANVRLIKYLSGTVGVDAVYKLYLFNITTTDTFKDAESIVIRTGATVESGADVNLLSKAGGLVGGDTTLTGTDSRSLVFPLNHSYVADLRDELDVSQTDFTFQRTFTNVNFTGATGVATISTDTGFEVFQGGAGAYSSLEKNQYYHVVVTSVTSGAGVAVGDVLDFTTGSRTITGGSVIVSSPHSLTFDADVSGTNFVATIIATINANGQQGKTKTLSNYKIKIISSPNEVLGSKDSLEIADIYDLKAVYNTSTTNPTAATVDGLTGDITWNGVAQHIDVTNRYELDNGQRDDFYDWGGVELIGTAPAATDHLLIVYRNFTHSSATGRGYFSVNSYEASGITYENIPKFVSPTTGETINLRDAVDFRPRRSDSGTAYELGQIPDPDFTFNSDYSFYVGRQDILSVTRASDFSYKQGTPSQEPVFPQPETSSMPIYTLEIPPYTENLGEVNVTYIDNKRYTMRDIGRLENRIKNVEYYTQLNFLEQQAKTQSVPDSNNSEKFKNGIFVDPFVSMEVQDTSNNDLFCYTDVVKGEVRAFAELYNADIDFLNATNCVRTGDLVTLSYTQENFVEQPFATETSNVNPFNVVSFIGTVNLEPSQDMWVETNRLPPNVVVNTRTIGWGWGNPWGWNAGWGWGGWGWGGFGGWNGWGNWGWNWGGWNGWGFGWGWRPTTTVTQSRTSLGDNVVDTSFLPFIRARLITVVASGLKPNSTHYAFFDTTAVSSMTRTATKIVVSSITGTVFDDSIGVYEPLTFSGGATARASMTTPAKTDGTRIIYLTDVVGTISNGDTITGTINGGTASVDSVTTSNYGDQIVTDEFGMIVVEFDMPGETFRNGDRQYTLLSNSSNNRQTATSIGDGSYNALGQQRTVQETILVSRTVVRRPLWSDPIAESFLVDENVYPNGVFVTSLELFFSTKAASIPVFVQIREMVNGFPKNTTSIPFAEAELYPEDVNTSIDGSVGTTFTFPSPINLEAGEYCFVVLSNSNEYEVFVSVMGDNLITDPSVRVTDQPYAGSMFSSQNSSTWTPNQEKDIKFNLNKAVFNTSGTAEFVYSNKEFSYTLVADTTSASADLTNVADITYSNIGLGMYVEGTGIPADTYIIGADRDAQTITLSNNATATDTGVSIVATGIPEYGTISVNASTIINNTTDIGFTAKAMSRASGTMDINYSTLENGSDYNFPEIKQLVPNSLNGGNSSLEISTAFSTGDVNTSPIIDIGRFSAVLAKNVINNSTVGEDSNRGGETLSRYITVPVTLADGFDASNIVVTFDAYKPSGTNTVVYMRTLPSEATSPMQEENWVQMDQYVEVPNSVDSEDYREHKFYPPNAFDSLNVPIDNPVTERFNSFQIKIAFISSNEAYTPKVKNFRLIALDT